MKKHELKILPQYFQAVWSGIKTFELRKDDRDYQRGDILAWAFVILKRLT